MITGPAAFEFPTVGELDLAEVRDRSALGRLMGCGGTATAGPFTAGAPYVPETEEGALATAEVYVDDWYETPGDHHELVEALHVAIGLWAIVDSHGHVIGRVEANGAVFICDLNLDPIGFDFFGVIVSADLSDWNTSSSGATVGGPDSSELVGPAVFELSGGVEIVVNAGTPGGDLCAPLLDRPDDETVNDECIVLGEMNGDGSAAAWYGLLDGHTVGQGSIGGLRLVSVARRKGVIRAPFGERFEFPLAPQVVLDCLDGPASVQSDEIGDQLPEAAEYAATINPGTSEIEAIECRYTD